MRMLVYLTMRVVKVALIFEDTSLVSVNLLMLLTRVSSFDLLKNFPMKE